ncbi:hypothetical protein NKH77_38300 [Streptomyces sp. M19]
MRHRGAPAAARARDPGVPGRPLPRRVSARLADHRVRAGGRLRRLRGGTAAVGRRIGRGRRGGRVPGTGRLRPVVGARDGRRGGGQRVHPAARRAGAGDTLRLLAQERARARPRPSRRRWPNGPVSPARSTTCSPTASPRNWSTWRRRG